jgi:hypothetical protein
MADKHISETIYLSLKEMVKSYAQSKWLYINRAVGRYCYHSIIDGHLDAGPAAGEETGKGYYMPIETKTMGPYVRDVHARERRLFQ